MTHNLFYQLTNRQIDKNNDIIHTTINYVDDSTSVNSSKSTTQLQNYIDNYYRLIDSYYNINFLKLNPEKTKFILRCKPTLRQHTKDITLQAGNYVIK